MVCILCFSWRKGGDRLVYIPLAIDNIWGRLGAGVVYINRRSKVENAGYWSAVYIIAHIDILYTIIQKSSFHPFPHALWGPYGFHPKI